MAGNTTLAERIAALEVRFDDIQKRQSEQSRMQTEINGKLDDLLALRNKGVGAFWLASTLLGTGIIGALYSLFTWWKH